MNRRAQGNPMRQVVIKLLSIPMLFGGLVGSAAAIGKPHLVPTCIQDAKLDYRKINDPAYVSILQGVIDKFGDNRTVVFIECSSVEGLFAFVNADDASFPKHSYIVYDPTFVRLATQGDGTKLLFLLGHEYGHFSLGHFNEQSDLSTYDKELSADQKGGCAVARSDGDLDSLLQILSGLRDPTPQGGYPSLADSTAAVRRGYEQCRSQG